MCLSTENGFASRRRRTLQPRPASQLVAAQDDYLLRACLRYSWNDVLLCCSTLLSLLLQHGETPPISVVEIVQRQLTKTDSWGNTPLHAACHYNPPEYVVQILLDLASTVNVPLSNTVNSHGATPLVICCNSGGAKLPVMLLLLEGLESIRQLTDDRGNSVFWGLTSRYQMLRKVPVFSKTLLPLEDISVAPEGDTHAPCNDSQVMDEVDDLSQGFDKFWTKMKVLIEAAWLAEPPSLPANWSILHGAAHVSALIPPVLTKLLLRCHHMLASKTVSGVLPLHLAVSNNYKRGLSNMEEIMTLKTQNCFFIQQLLEEDSSTAACRVPDSQRLPLTEAIASGISWHSSALPPAESTTEHATEKPNSSLKGPLQHLLKAYPQALEERDPVTGLYPSLLAAASAHGETADDKDQLDTVYCMLRLNPSFIASEL
jgi:ankyrin repeat protein